MWKKSSGLLSEDDMQILFSRFALSSYPKYNTLLVNVMKKLRKARPKLSLSYTHSVMCFNDLLQLWIQSPPCRFSEAGFCSVCNYWNGSNINNIADIVIPSVVADASISSVLLNTCGSVLDEYELPYEQRIKIFAWLKSLCINEIIFETHISTLKTELLKEIAEVFLPADRKIYFEVGIESIHDDILFFCYNKPPYTEDFGKVLQDIHSYKNFGVIANVMLGAPFLTAYEQEQDAIKSIIALINHGFDYVVLFPVNIKPYTLPNLLLNRGYYRHVKLTSLINVLNNLPEEILSFVNIAWYGNRHEDGVISPENEQANSDEVIALLDEYNAAKDSQARGKILHSLNKFSDIQNEKNCTQSLRYRIEKAYSMLKNYIEQEVL